MQIGLVGDIHGAWDEQDTRFFNTAGYDALLLTGDLPRFVGSLPIARALSALTPPAYMIAGNHDATGLVQLYAEMADHPRLKRVTALGMPERVARLAETLSPITLGAYSRHPLAENLDLVVARPHAMGGDRLYFRDYLSRVHGVTDLDGSRAALCRVIDEAARDIVILAHNGPAGLGETPDAPFGCDFDPARGDFGDVDLAEAITHARATGHRVRAVVAGHMHHLSKDGRVWRRTAAVAHDTLYINAARVPRIENGGARRHHIALDVTENETTAETRWVDADGNIVAREALPVTDDGASPAPVDAL
ncbi:metallophosphoesterase [Salinisphaera sp. Q1T1-3]|uniref:metallophosphoesterase n=1 Tax=Salinisphaera sp. Q1T1-3 TaxID=2321229 RepID=UPI00131449FE|nr:metallophosphoesterase [Salinisphaera sp. Q1T1-3]